ncbi:OadG family protein [Thiocystis violascens]|uniref:Probable oxaloacetate decarboxylase gamma chain n=1 Tax=Thiocystis violascens (strain ATCC 17096 / DSM 198 / 6111) TaxID=765911 RepID=I3YBR9_THIV6|nr:OadG family transporter subunit [Thiocystis violascens]AFL74437.1 sodium pump decarboxylase gamma subunit family protein [Thiocystis violascens DSM 198]
MNESALLIESLRLMVIGMGIVYAFLLLLVGVLRLMSTLILRLAPEETPALATAQPQSPSAAPDDLIAVIAAAVARYRRHH